LLLMSLSLTKGRRLLLGNKGATLVKNGALFPSSLPCFGVLLHVLPLVCSLPVHSRSLPAVLRSETERILIMNACVPPPFVSPSQKSFTARCNPSLSCLTVFSYIISYPITGAVHSRLFDLLVFPSLFFSCCAMCVCWA
jgi:hypothetical protein